jgi:prevent-host-death family protein
MVRFRTYHQTMLKANIADAKARLSAYLESVERGETVVLCRRNVPIAEIRPLPKPPAKPRRIGTDPGLKVPDSFFEPLPDDVLEAFGGGGDGS